MNVQHASTGNIEARWIIALIITSNCRKNAKLLMSPDESHNQLVMQTKNIVGSGAGNVDIGGVKRLLSFPCHAATFADYMMHDEGFQTSANPTTQEVINSARKGDHVHQKENNDGFKVKQYAR